MNQDVCDTCVYYRRHYVFDQRHLFRVYCGHCTFLKAKARKPDAKSCENYIPSDPGETAFVRKEYLSKVLLEYVLGLELLPEIHNLEEKTDCKKK
ncbi:MAG: hypothetical protein IJC85_01895 [Oscillospiraceae bacterium]|nr:hypothetical protein [Oscillospiraceae bacterium]MBQ4101620.1 hypothetical protein [Oscillospiraceae bacterium]